MHHPGLICKYAEQHSRQDWRAEDLPPPAAGFKFFEPRKAHRAPSDQPAAPRPDDRP